MKPEEIRKQDVYRDVRDAYDPEIYDIEFEKFNMLREIAAQLSELNEKLDKLLSK